MRTSLYEHFIPCKYTVKTYITNIPKLVTLRNDVVYNYKNIITELVSELCLNNSHTDYTGTHTCLQIHSTTCNKYIHYDKDKYYLKLTTEITSLYLR